MKAKLDAFDAMKSMNESFPMSIKPEGGVFGTTRVDKGLGSVELTGKTEQGRYFREYFQNDQLVKRRLSLGNHEFGTTYFDDCGKAYLTVVNKCTESGVKYVASMLEPNSVVSKGNFTAMIDELGRPIVNKMTDVTLRPEGVVRQQLSKDLYDNSYLKDKTGKLIHDRGHLVADLFGGPATKENIVAQLTDVNRSQFKQVENTVKKLVEAGHKVDYEVRTNYVGTSTRPSSFEFHIEVDGQDYELPKSMQKIYNSGERTVISRAITNVGEKVGLASELGVKNGAFAAALALPVSAVDNISAYIDGKLTVEEMVRDIAEDTATAAVVGYGTTFITASVSQAMSASSVELISTLGGSAAPAAITAFAVGAYEELSSFARGSIDAGELAFNLGENAAGVAGSFAGGTAAGMLVGSIGGPVGSVAAGAVGGMVGCVLATEAYASAVDLGVRGADLLGGQVERLASTTMECVAKEMPSQVENVRAAFNSYFSANALPFGV